MKNHSAQFKKTSNDVSSSSWLLTERLAAQKKVKQILENSPVPSNHDHFSQENINNITINDGTPTGWGTLSLPGLLNNSTTYVDFVKAEVEQLKNKQRLSQQKIAEMTGNEAIEAEERLKQRITHERLEAERQLERRLSEEQKAAEIRKELLIEREQLEANERLKQRLAREQWQTQERIRIRFERERQEAEERIKQRLMREQQEAEQRLIMAIAQEEQQAQIRIAEQLELEKLEAQRRWEQRLMDEQRLAQDRLEQRLKTEELQRKLRFEHSLLEEQNIAKQRLQQQLEQEAYEAEMRSKSNLMLEDVKRQARCRTQLAVEVNESNQKYAEQLRQERELVQCKHKLYEAEEQMGYELKIAYQTANGGGINTGDFKTQENFSFMDDKPFANMDDQWLDSYELENIFSTINQDVLCTVAEQYTPVQLITIIQDCNQKIRIMLLSILAQKFQFCRDLKAVYDNGHPFNVSIYNKFYRSDILFDFINKLIAHQNKISR